MRANKLHVVRFRGVCSVIELSEKKGDKYILAAPPCAVPTAWGLTKLKLLIAVLNRFAPCGGRESPVGRWPWQG